MTSPDAPQQPPQYPPAPGFGAPPPPPGYGASPQPTRLRGRVPRLLGWIFLVIAVAGLVAGGVILGTKSFGKVNGFQRVDFASGGTVHLSGTGKYVIYLEGSNVDSLKRVPFTVEVTAPSGQRIPFTYYGNPGAGQKVTRFTYDYNGHNGIASYQFNAPAAGDYGLRAAGTSEVPTNAKLAVGRDIKKDTAVGGVLIVIGVIALIAAIVLLIVGFVKRGRHKRELTAGAYGGPPPPGFPPSGYPQQGYPQAPPPGYPQQAPPPGYPQQYGGQPPAPPAT